jgi:multidrug efflux pump subunit AcrA (membrane-fusion protein)
MKTPLIFGICLLMAGCSAKEEASPPPVVDVRAVRAEAGDVHILVNAPATIFPRQQANIAARLTAPIRQLHVRKGDNVSAGQVLADLEDRDLVAQRDEAAAAVVDADASRQKTTSGTLPTDVERARGEVANTEASLNRAQKIYDRRRELFAQGAIASRDLLTSETELSQAKTSSEVAKKSLDLLLNQSREQDFRIAQSRLDQAKARLSLLDAQLQFTKIQCPFDGTIVSQFMYAGDMAKPDAPIFTVMDLSVAIVRAQVPEGRAGSVRTGQACSFSPADSPASTYEGKSTMVNRTVDPTRRTIEVWCEIPRPGPALRAGAFGNATIITGTTPRSVLVPLPAVQFQEGTRNGFVMVIDEKHAARKRNVETGEIINNMVQIIKGLNPGELVIVEGGYGLLEGTEVKTSEAGKK